MSEPRSAEEGMVTELGPVQAKCEDHKATGHWLCLSHAEPFPHNLAMQGHCEKPGEHIVAWVCHVHGPEVP